jgi:ATP-binding cassette subfamily B protein
VSVGANTVIDPAEPTSSTLRSLARLYRYAKPAMPRIYVAIVASLVASLLALAIPQILQWLIDGPLTGNDVSLVWWAAGLVLALGVLEAGLIAVRRWLVLTPGTHVEAAMRNSFFAHLQDLPVAFHDRWTSGQLLSRVIGDLNLIRRWMSFGFVLLIVNIITILVGFGILLSTNLVLGTLFLVASIPVILQGYFFEKRYARLARLGQDQQGDLATSVEESVHGIRVLKAFGRGAHALKGFGAKAEQLRGTELHKAREIAGVWLWLLLIPDVAFAVALVLGVWLVSTDAFSVGELVAFFGTATVLLFPIQSMGYFLAMTIDARTATNRFFEVMDSVNTITDPDLPETISEPHGRLEFQGVHFRYQDSPEGVPDLLDGIDLVIEAGETMALVGLTGSGKTTLTALPPRLYDVTGGRILLDGVDIRNLTRRELRTHIAMAFEDATLFSASVRDNILLGRPGGDDALLAKAIGIAQAQFVYDLPNGVQTLVGEEGLSLSGGQRQRLALARAIAAQPSVLVLDDPLSALDVGTEARIEVELRRVLASTTGLVIAHRPSTVLLADRVALLEKGRITAVGTHSALLAENEHYRFVISSLVQEDLEARSNEAIA